VPRGNHCSWYLNSLGVPNHNPNRNPGQCCWQSFRCRWLQNYVPHPLPAFLLTVHCTDPLAFTYWPSTPECDRWISSWVGWTFSDTGNTCRIL